MKHYESQDLDQDLPYNTKPTAKKKVYNQILSKKGKEYQQLTTYPTSSLWGVLFDSLQPHSNTGEK